MNLIKEAREAAQRGTDYTKCRILRDRTDELQNIFGRFTISCSRADMSELVGAWTRVLLALNELPPAAPNKSVLTKSA